MKLTDEQNKKMIHYLIEATGLKPSQIDNTVQLLQEGATVPFIARYRKEHTGELDEVQIRTIEELFAYFSELEERKITVLKSIEEQ
ncbi:MAG: Tex-like N-terminal domain-containing protein, partial [Desulfuromonadaceae bacterium]|nr:Tex-like N-terminal domain-containing protein [Desulfuromonadaceae bacterium]